MPGYSLLSGYHGAVVIGTFSYACPWHEGLFKRSKSASSEKLFSMMYRRPRVGLSCLLWSSRTGFSDPLKTVAIIEASQQTAFDSMRFIRNPFHASRAGETSVHPIWAAEGISALLLFALTPSVEANNSHIRLQTQVQHPDICNKL
jgi:hypothetical protein